MMNLNFNPFPVIETERLQLRQMVIEDADELFFLRSDPGVMKYIDRPRANAVSEAADYIEMINIQTNRNEVAYWAITMRNQNKLIGTICLWRFEKDNRRCEVGYMLHPDFHRKGIMKETLKAVLNYGFTTLNLHTVYANINPDNDASRLLLLNAGFKQEAYFRENYFYNNKFLDTAMFCIISPF
jgi:ribosomal-protein-alanine N-acetyltransferase